MPELETLLRAKMYIEKLANGINPIDGTLIPDEDIVNNVHISRCFFYVANVLQQVIDNSGSTTRQKVPFCLPAEKRDEFVSSTAPIPISEIAKRINALVKNDNMATLGYTAIRDWLLSMGMLEETIDVNGKTAKRPTREGENLGIHLETRTGKNGVYYVVVYNTEAQHFIVDNLDAIVEYDNAKTENQGKPWSQEQDKHLKELYRQNVPIREIAAVLKRSTKAIRGRLKNLGITK